MSETNRRNFLAYGVAAATSAVAQEAGISFGNRCHIFARPEAKEKLSACFTDVLGCGKPMALNAPGLAQPILAWKFPGGGSLSVEFTEDALDEKQARKGAWLELWSADPAALKRRVLDAGLPQVHYAATNTFYFMIPGGQILGIVPARNPSAGELRGK